MSASGNGVPGELQSHSPRHARVAIDLGAESCRVSLLRWQDGVPQVTLIHRIPNGPVHVDGSLRWPFDRIVAGLEEGLRKAATAAPEGIASIAVDGWAVDYVRLGADGLPAANPHCYRDERTIATKEIADRLAPPEWAFAHAGAQPLRINTVYQLLADLDRQAPWVNLPEYVLYRLGLLEEAQRRARLAVRMGFSSQMLESLILPGLGITTSLPVTNPDKDSW